jgi:hypothetical protein
LWCGSCPCTVAAAGPCWSPWCVLVTSLACMGCGLDPLSWCQQLMRQQLMLLHPATACCWGRRWCCCCCCSGLQQALHGGTGGVAPRTLSVYKGVAIECR